MVCLKQIQLAVYLLDGQGQMKNEKVAEPSDLVQEKVKSAREAGIDMITGLVNQIIKRIYSRRMGTKRYFKLL